MKSKLSDTECTVQKSKQLLCTTVDRETFTVKIISRWWLNREIKTHEKFS